ncbi:hypothetical protein JDV02_004967 [Purpureocillium takamizusanense]|uniref:Peptidase S8/S53 domain-containing protein n=1 Tax=Purpureocillium takamizusanense TaxID=2060973 RepID=A0A9Q8QDG1_9HYPO|nr:uncharacterized protein JDV02_004967 [Purpureocillium takamizusanense]UNI18714.1 hypothetical protein JDV02_004967 [Purpureocillium takamizusanense]
MKASDSTVRFLREQHLDPEANPAHKAVAIHQAVATKRLDVVDDLLNLYPQDCPDARSPRGGKGGRTPIHNAAQMGLREITLKLIQKGADVNARTKKNWTALILAAEAGRTEIVKLLLKHGADVNAQTQFENTSTKGFTALHVAAELRTPNTILTLLLHGADPMIATPSGETPLHFAVRARSAPAASLLLFHGASATAKDEKGVTPRDLVNNLRGVDRRRLEHIFDCASGDGKQNNQIQSHLKAEGSVDMGKAIHWAVEKNLDRAIAYILHADPHAVEARTPRGWHPLHHAGRYDKAESAEMLLQHGADVNCMTKSGWTPLMLAAEQGHRGVIRVLLNHDADRTMANNEGKTALQIAKHCNQKFIAMLLTVQHVAASDVVLEAPTPSSHGLSPPVHPGFRRTPSPGPRQGSEIEGELYALSDASATEASIAAPENSEYMERFFAELERTWYKYIQWHPDDDGGSKTGGQEWAGPVKIAILDTGIDLKHDDFANPARRRSKMGQRAARQLPEKPQRERIKACRNFVGEPGQEEDVTDYSGHGTHIAGLILGIAPRAELYIAKTSTGQEHLQDDDEKKPASKRGRREARRPVEEAIRWAMEQGVDIINLSLGFPRESSYDLTRALEEADHRGIAVFAAAANHGNREAIAWPARDRDLAVCVTSGDEFNNLSRFAPGPGRDLPVFITHGEDVASHWPTELGQGNGFRKMSGTSVATPIAVGMAAMVLAFLNRTNAWTPSQKRQFLDRSKERRLRSTRGMGRLLEHMCRDRNGLKVLSPKLMWEDDQDADPLKVLGEMAQAFKLSG